MSSSAREVRKTVTILFCDLVHSTGLAEGDPEAYRRIQTGFFDRMREIVERHGGTVEKFIGDEVMAVFGVPVVHEDDALRAVRAAQEMQDALPELGLKARIGINTGEVLAGDPDQSLGLVAGEPVIIAKRLEQGASAGEIIIGKATFPLVEHAVSAGPLERIPVKGKDADVARRRVEEVDHDAPSRARRLDLPLVGRDEELGLLLQAFERAVEEQSCRLFALLGPPGIGKSRLVAELATVLEDHATIAVGRCLPYGEGITFWPLAEILRSLGDVSEAVGEDGDAVRELMAGLTGESETPASSQEAFWAVRRAFEACARRRPLVVCFEDLHSAEPTLLDLIDYLAGWSSDAPILLVCLARPEVVERRPTLIAPRPNQDALALEPLDGKGSAALLDSLAGDLGLDAPAALRIADAAEGNPLFLEQLAAMTFENGSADIPVPPTIQALLGERLDRLTPRERETIERASVVGRDFPLSAVAALTPEDERGQLTAHLLALVRKQLFRPDTSRTTPEDRYRFEHVLIQEAAYGAMPKEVRAELHVRVADWATELALGPELDELVGYHLERAYRYREEIGQRDARTDEIGWRAGELLGRAGRRAFARDDMPAAVKLLDRALALVTKDEPAYPALLHELSASLFAVGEVARAEVLLQGVLDAAAASDDRKLEWTALLERAARRGYTHAEAGELLDVAVRAITVFEELGDDLGLARAWRRVASCHENACRFRAAEEACEHALEYARRAGSTQEEARTIDRLCTVFVLGPAPAEHAITRCESFLARPATPLLEANVVAPLAVLRAMTGDFDEARRLYARGEAIFEDLGVRLALIGATFFGGLVELLADDPVAAEQHLRRGYEAMVEAGFNRVIPFQGALLAEALMRQDRQAEAAQVARESSEAQSDDALGAILSRTALGYAELYDGRSRAAVTHMHEAVTLADETDALPFRGDTSLALADALLADGDPDGAAAAAGKAARLYADKGNRVAVLRAERFLTGTGGPV